MAATGKSKGEPDRARGTARPPKRPPRQRPEEVPFGQTAAEWRASGADWRVWFSWAFTEDGGPPIATEVAVESLETPRRRVGARVLGQLPILRLEEEARRTLREVLAGVAAGTLKASKKPRVVQRMASEYLERIGPPPGPPARRARLGEEHYRDVARVYREAESAGTHPTRRVAEWGGVPRSTAATWVKRARDRGLLGPAPKQGKRGEDTTREETL